MLCYQLQHDTKGSMDITKDIRQCFNNIKGYFYGATVNGNNCSHMALGNIDGETDITRVLQLKTLW